jgi:hypothetical protein
MSDLKTPPWSQNLYDKPRRVGVEIEMRGPTLEALSQTLADALGAKIQPSGRYEHTLIDPQGRQWQTEIDSRWIKELGREVIEGELHQSMENAIVQAARQFVPLELVSPPLRFETLPIIETLIIRLRDLGARGSSDGVFNAFGMQLNPEIPSRDPVVIVAFLQAFICLKEWLQKRIGLDIARQITGFAGDYSAAYIQKLLDVDYRPDQNQLIDDYLLENPTRNRALDLLPLLSYLDERRVRSMLDDPLIKPRPTFHYRLPSSEVHLPRWGLHTVWNDWIEVERLAADAPRRHRCMIAYRDWLARPLDRLIGSWPEEIESRWLAS